MSVSTIWNGYRITATHTGSKPAPWDDYSENWNHHRITISKDGRRTSFDFWAKIAKPRLTTREDLLGAFQCILSDALAGGLGFDVFCDKAGYDICSVEALKNWKACWRVLKKLSRVLGGDKLHDLGREVARARVGGQGA